MRGRVEALEEKLGHDFRDRELLIRAVTHRSATADRPNTLPAAERDNEQLEFLGDSILGFVVSEALVRAHPTASEGQLSRWKSHLVSSTHLYACARAVGLGEFLVLGKGEEKNGGRERQTLLSNALEAIIAAIHMDAGLEGARRFIEAHVLQSMESVVASDLADSLNHKSTLQERAQALGLPTPTYTTVGSSGPEHAKVFVVEGRVGEHLVSVGSGSSKKEASRNAAEKLIVQLLDMERNPRNVSS